MRRRPVGIVVGRCSVESDRNGSWFGLWEFVTVPFYGAFAVLSKSTALMGFKAYAAILLGFVSSIENQKIHRNKRNQQALPLIKTPSDLDWLCNRKPKLFSTLASRHCPSLVDDVSRPPFWHCCKVMLILKLSAFWLLTSFSVEGYSCTSRFQNAVWALTYPELDPRFRSFDTSTLLVCCCHV